MRSTALDLEDTEVPQLDPTFGNEGLDDRVEGALDDVLGLELGQPEVLGNPLGDLFLRHLANPPGEKQVHAGRCHNHNAGLE